MNIQHQETTFFPKDKTAKSSLLFMYVNHKGHRIKKSTKLHTNPETWDKKLGRSKEDQGLNQRLDKMESHIAEVLKSNPNAYKLLEDLALIVNGKYKPEGEKESFIAFAERFTSEVKNHVSLAYSKSLTTTVNHLKRYEEKHGVIEFDEVDVIFFRKFKTQLMDLGLTKNTVGKNLLNVKRLMNEAVETGLTSNIKYKSRSCRVSKEDVNNIYLTLDELNKIFEKQYSKKSLQDAADRLLIGAFTGMRFSDFSRLKSVNFTHTDSGSFITQDQQKVDGRVIIPVHPIVKQVLDRNNGEPPKAISNQKFNAYLKIVGYEAGITSDVQRTRTEGHAKESKTYKKYELITSHTCRRSFATNAYLLGVPIMSIMSCTGHKGIVQFMNYIKINQIEMSASLVEHPFFK